MSAIATIDLGRFIHGNKQDKKGFAEELGDALTKTGFFILAGHGVERQLVLNAYHEAALLFSLTEKQKRAYEVPGGRGQRGYTSFGKEHAKDHAAPDLKEFWHHGTDGAKDLAGNDLLNVFPTEVIWFKPAVTALTEALSACAFDLLTAAAIYLGERHDFLKAACQGGNSVLRLIHYPPVPEGVNPASMRSAPHEDINLITLLPEATAPGLELLGLDGTWVPITAEPGQIIVDAGDMLQHLTGGLLRSTTHRVTNPDNSRDRRFSMPFFVHPKNGFDLTPRAAAMALLEDKVAARPAGLGRGPYDPITAGQYLAKRLREIGLG